MAFVLTRSRQALRLELLQRSMTLIATFLRRFQITPTLCERSLNKMELKVRVGCLVFWQIVKQYII
jgi:hypothetical protein